MANEQNGKKTLVLASDNAHKAEEFSRYFADAGVPVSLLTMRQAGFCGEIVEDAVTFEGNALRKARAVSDVTGQLCIADDSGLEVDALGGAPGVFSARYAGVHGDDEANICKLLQQMQAVPDALRTARFVCAVCVVRPDGAYLTIRGTVEGKILREKRGTGTFGYDPIFLYEPFQKTFAELDGTTKNEVSHRGNALRQLLQKQDFFLK